MGSFCASEHGRVVGMNSAVKVSVVMAVYNAMPYLKQALDTLESQTLQEVEIICVDDGSSDGSYEYLCSRIRGKRNMYLYRNLIPSEGAALARNIGIAKAKGEYLSILDADDFFDDDMLEKTYNHIVNTRSDVVMFDAWRYDEKNKIDRFWNYLRDEYLPKGDVFSNEEDVDFFNATHGAAWDKLFRREFIEAYNIRFMESKFTDDLVFTYTALSCAKRVGVLRKKLLHYRYNTGSNQSATIGEWPEIAYKAAYQLRNEMESRGTFEKYKIGFSKYMGAFAWSVLDSMNTVKNYERLFFDLKNEYLSKLGILDLSETDFDNTYHFVCREVMLNVDKVDEFFFERRNHPYIKGSNYNQELVKHLNPGTVVALYGAGNKGRKAFMILLDEPNYTLSVWVDKNYKEIGFPVRSVDEIYNTYFDKLWIAKNKKISDAIREELVNMGIPNEKIIWF